MISCLFAVALIASTTVAVAPSAQARRCYRADRGAKGFTHKINHLRVSHGLGRLNLDPQLSHVAHHHDKRMVRRHRLFHTSYSQFNSWVTRWNYVAENVGVGPGVRSLFKAFKQSPEHRANMLGWRYNHVGIGTIRRNGKMWVTIQFEAQRDPGTRLHMPAICG